MKMVEKYNQVELENEVTDMPKVYGEGGNKNKKNFIFKVMVAVAVILIAKITHLFDDDRTVTVDHLRNRVFPVEELVTYEMEQTMKEAVSDSAEWWLGNIPFTKHEYLVEGTLVYKAGYNCEDIKFEVKGKTIYVDLPDAEILYAYATNVSTSHLNNNIINPAKARETDETVELVLEREKQTAIDEGLLTMAKENAKKQIEQSLQGLEGYKVEFREI